MKMTLVRNTLLVAVLAGVALYFLRDRTELDFPLLFGGNILLAFISILSGWIGSRSNPNKPASFLRGLYSGTFLRLFLLGGAAFLYILTKNGVVDRNSLLILACLYILYTGMETFVLQKLTRQHTAMQTRE